MILKPINIKSNGSQGDLTEPMFRLHECKSLEQIKKHRVPFGDRRMTFYITSKVE